LNDIQLKGEDVMSAPNDLRYPTDPFAHGSDQRRDGTEIPDTPPSARVGRSRRGGTRFAGDIAPQQFRKERSFDRELTQEVLRQPRRSRRSGRLPFVIVMSAVAVFIVVQVVPTWRASSKQMAAGPAPQPVVKSPTTGVKVAALEPFGSVPASVPKPAAVSTTRLQKPVLRAADAPTRTAIGEAVPLGLNVEGSTDGVVANVAGLLAGSNLSVGSPIGPTDWQLPARDLAEVLVRPPAGFSGTMEVVVDLQMGGGQIVDRRWRRLEWTGAGPARAAAASATPPAPMPAAPDAPTVAGSLGPKEIAILIGRGEQLLATGDLSSARLLLRRAAEARDARAAFALASTYDPLVLSKLRVRGFAPDAAAARHWYQKAAELGSREAPARLDMLSSTGSR
jgi:hypothetical protein